MFNIYHSLTLLVLLIMSLKELIWLLSLTSQVFLDVNKQLCKRKCGSVRGQAPDSCCIPRVPLRIARAPLEDRALENGVKEGCTYSQGDFPLGGICALHKTISRRLVATQEC